MKSQERSPSTSRNTPVVGRFAPSPTGPLHVGSLVAALGSYLLAKHSGGKWLIRMEDLDLPRVVPGIADDMLRTLESLGFQWDGEIWYQSRRNEIYRAAVEELSRKGFAYPCGCTRAEIARIASAPHEDGLVYPGLCRGGLAPGKVPRALRLLVPDEIVTFRDQIMGNYSQHLGAACGDFVIQRADGPYAYHLAVVIDDALSGVNQIVRGADLLSSTPRQIHLQGLLGHATPVYAHLPLVTGAEGGKLSKRDNSVSLSEGRDLSRAGGQLLCAALNFLGQQPPTEISNAPASEILAWGVQYLDVSAIPADSGPFTL
ncbi:tRNA glutamyl-Q(34) synthetase GluQRS [Geomesophilobacter sediminis]|uniref:Glutamyl-Q tRNA(Asp) synthetase n=1 Tax=Geomesophilobacter sediminis TaxID=2798584 RepID=A0A8J7LXH4_9BACT|nr:tRNA glutamyl-Q(34) synthetase GluQRS [Geomesophilobacter sediminis]MBJ6723091.1 tRNA glutamyl-Q(34) synthetase GluQRS [Geomesophilobacter sediminis]